MAREVMMGSVIVACLGRLKEEEGPNSNVGRPKLLEYSEGERGRSISCSDHPFPVIVTLCPQILTTKSDT